MEISRIPIKAIERSENSRANIGDVAELMKSIKSEGLLSPLIVCPNYKKDPEHAFILVAGNRRFEALFKLGEKEVPCFIREDINSEQDLMVTNLLENIQRVATSPYEEGRYVYHLINTYLMSVKEVAVRLSISESHVATSLKIFERTPEKFRNKIYNTSKGQERLIPGKIPVTMAKYIMGIQSANRLRKEQVEELYSACMKRNINHYDLRKIARCMANGDSFEAAKKTVEYVGHARMDLPFLMAEMKTLQKKYDLAIHPLVIKILTGEIPERLTGQRLDHLNKSMDELLELIKKAKKIEIDHSREPVTG